jgi:YebC/PmpR family DNA-binding regulatory protein
VSGHSKWANIKRKKAKVDAAKGSAFSRLTKEVMSAARQGGPNPETNFKLRLAVARARDANVPLANIERAIQRAQGSGDGQSLEEVIYEGYGPGSAAVLLEILTDNRNRTAGEIRHLFSRYGGNLGESGSVLWMFDQVGLAVVPAVAGVTEERVLEVALEAGADDVRSEDGEYWILSSPEALEAVNQALERSGLPVERAEVTRLPQTSVDVRGAEAERLLRLLDLLEEHDDVQRVYSNADLPEESDS